MRFRPALAMFSALVLVAFSACQEPSPDATTAEDRAPTALAIDESSRVAPIAVEPEEAEIPESLPAVATAPPTDGQPLDVTGEVQRPVRIKGSPIDLRDADCPEGTRWTSPYLVQVVVTKEGRLSDIHMLKPAPACVETYLQTTLSEWLFEPATLGGKPVAVNYSLALHVHLR